MIRALERLIVAAHPPALLLHHAGNRFEYGCRITGPAAGLGVEIAALFFDDLLIVTPENRGPVRFGVRNRLAPVAVAAVPGPGH